MPITSTAQHELTETGKAMANPTPYDVALAAIPNAKKVTLPAAKPPPTRKVAGGRKAVGPVQKAAAKMTQDSKAKTAAIKAGKLTAKERDEDAAAESIARDDKDREQAVLELHDEDEAKKGGHKYKAKKSTAKAKSTGKKKSGNGSGPVARITETWESAKGRDVKPKDRVKAADGTVIDVIGRWTKKTKTGNVPMVTGHVVGSTTADVAVEGKGKKVGDRCNAVAATVTHVKK